MTNDDDQLDQLLARYGVAPAGDMLRARLAAVARPPVAAPLHGWRRAVAASVVALAGFTLGMLQNDAGTQTAAAQHSYRAQTLWSLGAGQPVIF